MYDPYSTTEKDAGYYQLNPITPPPPPPEWKPKRHRKSWFFISLISIVVIVIAFLCGQYWSSVNHAKEPTSSPIMKSNYTVTDIVTDMKKDGCPCGKYKACVDGGLTGISPIPCQQGDNKLYYGENIDNTVGSDYATDIQAADSVQWPDPPDNLQAFSAGLWIYNSSLDAKSAYDSLISTINAKRQMTQPSPIIPTAYFHGKCLILLVDNPFEHQWSGYQQTLDKYCV